MRSKILKYSLLLFVATNCATYEYNGRTFAYRERMEEAKAADEKQKEVELALATRQHEIETQVNKYISPDSYSNLRRVLPLGKRAQGTQNPREILDADLLLAHFNVIENPTIHNALEFEGDEFALKKERADWPKIRDQVIYLDGISIWDRDFFTYDFARRGFRLGASPIPKDTISEWYSVYLYFLFSTIIPVSEEAAEAFKRSISSEQPARLHLILRFDRYENETRDVCIEWVSHTCMGKAPKQFRWPVFRIEKYVIVQEGRVVFHS